MGIRMYNNIPLCLKVIDQMKELKTSLFTFLIYLEDITGILTLIILFACYVEISKMCIVYTVVRSFFRPYFVLC